METGLVFTVYRGADYVGRLLIDRVEDAWSEGHMDLPLTRDMPHVSDRAETVH